MQPRDLHRPQKPTSPLVPCLQGSCLLFVLGLVYAALRAQPAEGPAVVYGHTPALHPVGHVQGSPQVEVPSFAKPASAELPAVQPRGPRHGVREHESDMPFAVLNRERKAQAQQHGSAFLVYEPTAAERPGGDMDKPGSLDAAVAASAAQKEVMLLCVGGAGSMRTGMNLVFNFRAMGLYNMLIFADKKQTCEALWDVLPQLACVYWPSRFTAKKPDSLYNTMFNKVALAFFEARKLLVQRLVLGYGLNLLHLDADTIWFANPFPIFKTLYKDHQLIVQTDNPFVNAGIFYVQNVKPGDSAAWFLEELNRRIERFTYHPETVTQLPSSGWSTPPHFANADEQANMNDIVASGLLGRNVYGNGVEFYEARFKKDKGSKVAAAKMRDGAWMHRTQQGDVTPARRKVGSLDPAQAYKDVVHLCKMSMWGRADVAELRVPGNASAPHASLLLAPDWLFSHFPYGAFFPSYVQCHADSWRWAEASAIEQRLCMPKFRVPVVMVHMSGLRNGQWGRRGVMRALGVWDERADQVAPEAWVSSRTERLLVTEGAPLAFKSMAGFDRFAARLLLLGLLLRRRVVMPSMPCDTAWARAALEPRHLRGLKVGCGPEKQCVWLPMPHYSLPWCSGVDFLYDIDYRALLAKGNVTAARDVVAAPLGALRLVPNEAEAAAAGGGEARVAELAPPHGAAAREKRVLLLQGGAAAQGEPLDWLSLDDFRSKSWKGGLARRVQRALERQEPRLSSSQLDIVKDCMHSLATSRD